MWRERLWRTLREGSDPECRRPDILALLLPSTTTRSSLLLTTALQRHEKDFDRNALSGFVLPSPQPVLVLLLRSCMQLGGLLRPRFRGSGLTLVFDWSDSLRSCFLSLPLHTVNSRAQTPVTTDRSSVSYAHQHLPFEAATYSLIRLADIP